MLVIRIHPTSNQQVRWPTRSADILSLGQTVLAAEQDLPANQQYPQLALLQTRLDALNGILTTAYTAEADRTAHADAEKTTFDTAKTFSRRVITSLTAKYVNVALLEAWGVEVVGTGTRARTRAPYKREGILRMLTRYIARENSLPTEQRITTPTLVEVTAARDALATAYTLRVDAITTRELANAQRQEASQALLQVLQLIANHHVVLDFGSVVDQNLQTLGYDLVTRITPHPQENGSNSEMQTK